MISLTRKLRLTPSHFGLLMSKSTRKGVTVLVGVTSPGHQSDLCSTVEARKSVTVIHSSPIVPKIKSQWEITTTQSRQCY